MRRRMLRGANGWMRGAGAALGLAVALPAAAQTPVGAEFQVNTYTTDSQTVPEIATNVDGTGTHVWLTWSSGGSFGTDSSLFSVQRAPLLGSESQVNTYTTGSQAPSSVAVAEDGDFVVVWESEGSAGTDTSDSSIQGQRYASSGSPQGGEFQVNSYTTGPQADPSVAVAGDGDFVVAWRGSDVRVKAQRFASNGSLQGSEFQVDLLNVAASSADVAAEPDGDFVVVWTSGGSNGNDTSSSSILSRRFASDGSSVGGIAQVNTYTTGAQGYPSVARIADGSFVVVWYNQGAHDVRGMRHDSTGGSVGAELLINDWSLGSTIVPPRPDVAMVPDGDFVVTWLSEDSPGKDKNDSSIQARRFDSDGSPATNQFQVNTHTTGYQFGPTVAALSPGGSDSFVVTWAGSSSAGTDTDFNSIHAQSFLFGPAPAPVPSLTPISAAAVAALMLAVVSIAFRRRARAQ